MEVDYRRQAALAGCEQGEHRASPSGWALGVAATDYLSLAKPRALGLVVITALAAMVVAAPFALSPGLVLATLLGGSLATAGANALNCYLDRDLDARMARTRHRPLPSGRLRPRDALAFGLALAAAGTLVLGIFASWHAAALALASCAFYVAVYTAWLKRATAQNIVIGGLAGAAAPVIGWVAVTHSVDPAALYLAAIILCWTPAHFWSLALLNTDDYRRAGVPMMPVVHGVGATKRQILLYALLTSVVSLLPAAAELLGQVYLVVALPLNLLFVAAAVLLLRNAARRWMQLLFKYSAVYLALLFLAMIVDRLYFS